MPTPTHAEVKFQEEDLPKILTAVKDARFAKERSTIIITVSDNGGVISVVREAKKQYK